MDYKKAIMLSLVVLIMAVGAISTAIAMNGDGDMNKGDDALRLREQSRVNQSMAYDASIIMDPFGTVTGNVLDEPTPSLEKVYESVTGIGFKTVDTPKPETQYDQRAQNTEHETERLRPNGTGDNCPKEP